ncbi:DUF4920 domain-containing protein [Patiriisocius hiemis]|uniref:DUF4920 domain-containing protein n=1 Tax=Patiriisocius hiemis TaxID=3075604 RepID=A0ABU2YG54_9FLAO|nr:DUF4920 domain-containing protein [Constantimarinum sp. W242]MDT0556770.1 DUF4920 domain-containing protein [Constantimarinum sp. W242]
MKKLVLVLFSVVLFTGCKNEKKVDEVAVVEEAVQEKYTIYGDEISDTEVLTKSQIIEKYNLLTPGDTVAVKFKTKVNEVCQNKGCWMKMDMGDIEAMVKFKDYAFFMPKDLAGEEVIVGGKAFVSEMSVEEQQHYAEDAGKTKEEIAAITEPKRTLSFLSNGVLIPVKEEQ